MKMIDKIMQIANEARAYHNSEFKSPIKKFKLKRLKKLIIDDIKYKKSFSKEDFMNYSWAFKYGELKFGRENLFINGFTVQRFNYGNNNEKIHVRIDYSSKSITSIFFSLHIYDHTNIIDYTIGCTQKNVMKHASSDIITEAFDYNIFFIIQEAILYSLEYIIDRLIEGD